MMTRLLGLLIMLGCLALIHVFESVAADGAFRIFHWPAMVLTGVGPLGAILLSSDWRRIQTTFNLVFRRSPEALRRASERETAALHSLIQKIYADGPRAAESPLDAIKTPYLVRALDRIALRMPISDVKHLLEREQVIAETDLAQSLSVVSLGMRLSPSIGMLGTILGMVRLLSSITDPANIGSHMGLALLTTFYGLFFSLVIWTPLHHRLESLRELELRGYDQALHWLGLLQGRKPAQYFAEPQP